jgi:hypothetical protein
MQSPIMQRLKSIVDPAISYALYLMLKPMTERYRTLCLSGPAPVIKAGGSALAKTGATITHYMIKGKSGQIAASTDLPAFAGTVTADLFNVFVYTVNSAGTTALTMGREAATEAAVKWPTINPEHAILAFIKVNPRGTGNFVGGTTALDDATVFTSYAAEVLYVSCVGMSFPTAKVD